MAAINFTLMSVDAFIRKRGLLEVTSSFIKASSSTVFDQNGMFSETIFGEVGTPARMSRHGYIKLNTRILHPEIFDVLNRMKALYSNIASGKTYAVFNNKIKDFEKSDPTVDGSGTGYLFFISHVEQIVFKKSDSTARTRRINMLEKNRGNWFMDKYLLMPAGMRDYREDETGRGESPEVNNLYRRLLELASTLEGSSSNSPIYDSTRFAIQKVAIEIFEYWWELFSFKKGFMQKKFASRSVMRATRNVLVAPDVSASKDNPEALLNPDEIGIPLLQAMAAFMPLFKYHLRTIFYDHVFSLDTTQVSAIEPETFKLTYVEVEMNERAKFIQSEKIEAWVMRFADEELRHDPVTVIGSDKKRYYLYLKAVVNGVTYYGRSYDDLKTHLKETGIADDLKLSDVEPLTYYEMYYHACYFATRGKHGLVTRYPVTGTASTFVGRVHLMTTSQYTNAKLASPANPDLLFSLARYPIRGSSSINGMSIYPTNHSLMDADHDGDMTNFIPAFSEEANGEMAKHLASPKALVNVNGELTYNINSKLAIVTLYALTS